MARYTLFYIALISLLAFAGLQATKAQEETVSEAIEDVKDQIAGTLSDASNTIYNMMSTTSVGATSEDDGEVSEALGLDADVAADASSSEASEFEATAATDDASSSEATATDASTSEEQPSTAVAPETKTEETAIPAVDDKSPVNEAFEGATPDVQTTAVEGASADPVVMTTTAAGASTPVVTTTADGASPAPVTATATTGVVTAAPGSTTAPAASAPVVTTTAVPAASTPAAPVLATTSAPQQPAATNTPSSTATPSPTAGSVGALLAADEASLFAATAADTAAAVADAVLHPEATNWGTTPRGLETRPLVWTVQSKNGECPAGYYLDGSVCRRCAQGHVRKAGQSACVICQPGTFADVELQECRPCAKGNYAHWHAMTRCLWCRPGSYSDEMGATKCKPCPAGLTSAFQAHKCS